MPLCHSEESQVITGWVKCALSSRHSLPSSWKSTDSPHCEQAVDEAMIPFQGRSSLKQYLPAKPVKRGIKVWCRSDSHNGYISEFQIYTGRSASGEKEINLGGRVVLDLTQKLEGRHYHIYFDNFFTSTTLLSSLLSRGFYACGTARLQRLSCGPKDEGKRKEGNETTRTE